MKARHAAPKPRNPLVALARFKRAGAHRGGRATGRQAAHAALRKEIDALKEGP
ncbi:MAG: hypothetical protein BroJett031_03630 [Betaproteobacteria bacterium]|nr:MAG: hypothetical protein BroJett031_03630 [Betaproteobacteria bacterium]